MKGAQRNELLGWKTPMQSQARPDPDGEACGSTLRDDMQPPAFGTRRQRGGELLNMSFGWTAPTAKKSLRADELRAFVVGRVPAAPLSARLERLRAVAKKTLGGVNCTPHCLAGRKAAAAACEQTPPARERAGAAAPLDARSCRKPTKRSTATPLGSFSVLPPEVVDLVLLRCGPTELAALVCTCRYFSVSGAAVKAARTQLESCARGRRLTPEVSAGESWLLLLRYVEAAAAATTVRATLGLGGHHTVVVFEQVATTVPARGPLRVRPAASDAGLGKGRGTTRLLSCGRGFHGQLGRGTYDEVSAASPVDTWECGALGPIVSVACGGSHSAAVSSTGDLLTWGLASSGELGHGGWTPIEQIVPRQVGHLSRVRITSVAAGWNHTVAMDDAGMVWTCGRGRQGQLGHGDYLDVGRLLVVAAIVGTRVAAIAAGGNHTAAVLPDGAALAWGSARYGQLGAWVAPEELETGVCAPRRVDVPPAAGTDLVAVSCGATHTAGVTGEGYLLAWGRNRHGQLGLGDTIDRNCPTRVPLLSRNKRASARVLQVACGGSHTVVLTGEGAVLSAGNNGCGQLGHGDRTTRKGLTQVRRLAGITGRAVAAGEDHSLVVASDGTVYAFGRGDHGQLGTGDNMAHWFPKPLVGVRAVLDPPPS